MDEFTQFFSKLESIDLFLFNSKIKATVFMKSKVNSIGNMDVQSIEKDLKDMADLNPLIVNRITRGPVNESQGLTSTYTFEGLSTCCNFSIFVFLRKP